MLQLKAQSQRLQLILDFLKEQAFMRASFAQIHDYLRAVLPSLGLKTISRRSLESDLQILREEGGERLLHVRVSKKHYYQLLSAPHEAISNTLKAAMLEQIASQLGASTTRIEKSLQ
ncbi:MAG: hypothetical protein RL349_1752, partial [Bacteroidota bacterium]